MLLVWQRIDVICEVARSRGSQQFDLARVRACERGERVEGIPFACSEVESAAVVVAQSDSCV